MKHLLMILLGALAGAAEPDLLADGHRQVLDLAGTWEAASTTVDLAWPAADAAWGRHPVPCQDNAAYIADGGVWASYAPKDILAADGRTPKDAQRQAAWFRRTVELPGGVPAGMRALLHCDQVAWRSAVRINGATVGGSLLGMVPSVHDITAALRPGANELAIGATGKAGLWDAQRKTYLAPFAPVLPGITGGVRLELVPAARIDDVWVRTSVLEKRLAVTVTVANADTVARTLAPTVVVRGPDGVVATVLRAPAAAVPAGGTLALELAAPWVAPHLWSPASPVLYRAEASLAEGAAEIDRQAVDFGFRDFTARKRDFLLNGNRQVLLRSSWLQPDLVDRHSINLQLRAELAQSNCIRLHLGFVNHLVPGQADRVGMLVIPEPAWFEHGVSEEGFPLAQAEAWLPATEDMWRRLVRRFRNHPSIVLWSLANEWSWNNTRPECMAVAARLVAAVRQADPTRLLQGDGEVTWDGRLDTINVHYPEGDAGTVGQAYNNSGWVVPNDVAWLKDQGLSRSWRGDFIWDRPLMIGEYYAQDAWEPEEGSAYMGDEAFDTRKWARQQFIGRGAGETNRDNGYLAMARMTSDHYRAAGVACLNPWAGHNQDIIPALVARPLDHHPNLFGGEPATRRLLLANDGTRVYADMHLRAALEAGGRTLWEDRQEVELRPGMSRQPILTIRPPAVLANTAARLVVRLCWGRGQGRELTRHEEPIWILPRPRLEDLDAGAVALVDGEGGATRQALAAFGLALVPGASGDDALAGKRLLVIGEGAAAGADLAAAGRFAAAGGRVVVLHQAACPPFVPGQPAIDPHHAATMSWRASDHPLLGGLADGQLRFWRGDHVVASESLVRPASGGIAVSGGRYGLAWSPLCEVRHGRGTLVFCQYLLAGRAAAEPAAAHLLATLVRVGLGAVAPAPARPLRLLAGVGKAERAVLQTCGVVTADGLDGDGPLLLDARTPPAAAELARIRAGAEAGGTVWLRGLDAATLPAVAALLPWTPGFAPLPAGTWGLSRCSDQALIQGLLCSDFHWARGPERARKPTAPLGGPVLVPPALGAAVALTEPALLSAVPCGKGWILVDQLAWEGAMAVESERVVRVVSTLVRNAGGELRPALTRRWRFAQLDLAAQANRGYLDAVAGDGTGGWTDQGDNDMRYFLINHTGKGEGGMAVAAQPFPTAVDFQGVPFRLVDPQANGGKAVVVLRGGSHDPQAPAAVRGIPAGGVLADRLWFLHAATWCPGGPEPVEVARYEVVYEDGTRAAAPVRSGRHIADWWVPRLLPEADIAWTGRNARCGTIVVYRMAWDNPHPGKRIAAVDAVGDLGGAQLVLLGITAGVEDTPGERVVAAWDCGAFAAGSVAAAAGGVALTGAGEVATVDGRMALRLRGGQELRAALQTGPLADGQPLAIEVQVAPMGPPGGYYGGLVHAGTYLTSGMRLLLRQDLRVAVEHFASPGEAQVTRLLSRAPLAIGRLATVRYEHDGRRARLLVDGIEHALQECPPAAPWQGELRLGVTSGTGYHLDGALATVRILALSRP
ncbi:MAG: cellulase family glycosylhydrolase [Planctomycetes bacterium]|nr:cellulase family glycosylhydrolase [Planctomycetota bacterium]